MCIRYMENFFGFMFSTSDPKLIEYSLNRNLSSIHTLTEWDNVGEKNFRYYTGQRFFRVSRRHYPQYTRGWIYGYYEDKDYGICDENGERTF